MTLSDPEIKIINAATEIFLQKGKDGARMQEIADKAGINKALLHYYFRSKDRLYDRVFETLVESFFERILDAILETEDAEQFIKGFVEKYVDALAERPELIRFIAWEIGQGASNFSKIAHTVFTRRGFSEIPFPQKIQQAINKGDIRPLDPVHLMLSLIGMCLYPFLASVIVEKIFPGVEVSSAAFIKHRKEEILNLIWQGIRPEAQ
jgi:TetR/AcrR family transcriptional regulator